MKVDLHLHTNHSDGNWSPSELVAHAVKIGMSVIAVTDHDTVSGIDEAIEAARPHAIEIIPGVEINSVWMDQSGRPQDIHILGYFIDKTDPALQLLFEKQSAARYRQVEELVRGLKEGGLNITLESVLQRAAGSPVGKVHVTQAIVAAGGAADVTEAYNKYYDRNSKYFVPRKSATPLEAIQAIRDAGGIPVIAHPGWSADLTTLILELARNGLGGIEAYHRVHDSNSIEQYLGLADDLNLIVTGGSDDHGPFQEHESMMGTIDVPPDVVQHVKRLARKP